MADLSLDKTLETWEDKNKLHLSDQLGLFLPWATDTLSPWGCATATQTTNGDIAENNRGSTFGLRDP